MHLSSTLHRLLAIDLFVNPLQGCLDLAFGKCTDVIVNRGNILRKFSQYLRHDSEL